MNEHSRPGEEQVDLPVVFVGSSSEAHLLADAVQKGLDTVADVELWSQGVFELNKGYLESLSAALERSDFAVLVLTPDDLVESRGESRTAPRDNVMFELGLFMGQLGRERCFFLYDKTKDIRIPTDLLGICAATYRPHPRGQHVLRDPVVHPVNVAPARCLQVHVLRPGLRQACCLREPDAVAFDDPPAQEAERVRRRGSTDGGGWVVGRRVVAEQEV